MLLASRAWCISQSAHAATHFLSPFCRTLIEVLQLSPLLWSCGTVLSVLRSKGGGLLARILCTRIDRRGVPASEQPVAVGPFYDRFTGSREGAKVFRRPVLLSTWVHRVVRGAGESLERFVELTADTRGEPDRPSSSPPEAPNASVRLCMQVLTESS